MLWLVCAYKRIQTWRLRLEVFLGLCTLSSKKANQRDVVIRCWCHEIQRVHLSWLFSLDGGCQKFTSIAWSDVKLHRFLCQAKNARSLVIGWLTTRIRSGWRRKSSETWLKTSAAWSVYMIYVSQEITTPKPPHILPRYSCIYHLIQKRCIGVPSVYTSSHM